MSEETVSLLTGIDHSPVTNLCMSYDLDFRKLKHHLATASIKTRLLLLQALRWLLSVAFSCANENFHFLPLDKARQQWRVFNIVVHCSQGSPRAAITP
uniref:Uncharacterized protein n=1 Tax=Timema douglasi TaxID=61478 RepID=A0A7R8VH37_TIMDO|nr:unnamed protein product [Timema douglasi]